MPPPRLNHSDFWIGKEMDSASEQVFFRNKIGVEDAKKFAVSGSQSYGKGASLKASPINPMDPLDVETALPQFLSTRRGDLPCLIRRIVKHLNLEKLLWIIEFAHGTDQPLGDVDFIENRQLDRHLRQFLKVAGRNRWPLTVFQIQINNEIAMDPISGKPNEHTQITGRPDNMSDAFLHGDCYGCEWITQ